MPSSPYCLEMLLDLKPWFGKSVPAVLGSSSAVLVSIEQLRSHSFNLYGKGNGSVASTPYKKPVITGITHTSHTDGNSWACSWHFPRKVTHDKYLLSRFPVTAAHELLFRLPEVSDKSGLVCVSVVLPVA